MLEEMKWEEVYSLWKYSSYRFSELLTAPIAVEPVFVEYPEKGYFYGFDWLENEDAQARKELIKKRPLEFLYFTRPTNKGTIRTAEMLAEAQNEEERAAIWIAATAKELYECRCGNGIGRYADLLYIAAYKFLQTRYYLWHHAMRRLVPEILIPFPVLESIVCRDAEPIMGLIQMNSVLLKNSWSILRYSSLKDEDRPGSRCRIDNEKPG